MLLACSSDIAVVGYGGERYELFGEL